MGSFVVHYRTVGVFTDGHTPYFLSRNMSIFSFFYKRFVPNSRSMFIEFFFLSPLYSQTPINCGKSEIPLGGGISMKKVEQKKQLYTQTHTLLLSE